MDLDVLVDDELHPRQADTVAGQLPPAQCRGRIGHIHHDLRACLRDLVEIDLFALEVETTGIDASGLALGA